MAQVSLRSTFGFRLIVYNNNINIIDIYNNFSYYIIYYIIIIYMRVRMRVRACVNVIPTNRTYLYDYKDIHNHQYYHKYPHNQYYYLFPFKNALIE